MVVTGAQQRFTPITGPDIARVQIIIVVFCELFDVFVHFAICIVFCLLSSVVFICTLFDLVSD